MSFYRKVDTRIWNDEKFMSLSINGKMVFLFLLTHPHMTGLGAMRANIPGLAAELKMDLKAFREGFREAFEEGMLEHCQESSYIGFKNFLKYNKPESPNVLKSWGPQLERIPECELKYQLMQRVKDFVEGLSKGFREALPEAFREPFGHPLPNQKQKQKQKQNTYTASDENDKNDSKSKATEVALLWNQIVEKNHRSLPTVILPITAARQVKINARLVEFPDLEKWRLVFEYVSTDPFHTGHGKTAWKATLDFVVRSQDSFCRTLERAQSQSAPSRQIKSMEEIRQEFLHQEKLQ